MPSLRLVALDLDGILLRLDGTISPRARRRAPAGSASQARTARPFVEAKRTDRIATLPVA